MTRKGNYRLDTAKAGYRLLKKKFPNDKEVKEICDNGIEDIDAGAYIEWLKQQEAKMIGVRNPAYDGDMVGYPEDDFIDYDESNDNEQKK